MNANGSIEPIRKEGSPMKGFHVQERAQELIDDYRRLVAEWTRAFDAWSKTPVGSADAALAFEDMAQLQRRADKQEQELLKAMVAPIG
jgi:molybdenum-dependent DNA-binding transcriptional regulator ModE